MARKGSQKKLGFAVVGLGHIAQGAVLPAFENSRSARLVALVSSDASKLRKLSKEYGVEHTYGYEEYGACLDNPEVDAVYIALPNDMHRDYTVRAAEKGVHVLCEKPMANSVRECEEMIDACARNDVRLMIAYRLHFEPSNLDCIELLRAGKIGDVRAFNSSFSYQVRPGNIRTEQEKGGGPLWDIGLYCINATRYLLRDEPLEVLAASAARKNDPRFKDVPETVSVVLRFPGERLASFTTSMGTAATAWYEVLGTKGELCLEDAYEYAGERTRILTIGNRTTEKTYPSIDQFAPELDAFAEAVARGRDPEPDGYEGLADVRILEAIEAAIASGRAVKIEPLERLVRPTQRQKKTRKAASEGPLHKVEAPHME